MARAARQGEQRWPGMDGSETAFAHPCRLTGTTALAEDTATDAIR